MAAASPASGGGVYRMLPIGFRFRPTDEELLLHYLRRKVLSFPLPADVIPIADLARLHPSDLLPGDGDGERYFFHQPATSCWRKGGGGGRAAGGGGVWRASGKEKLIVSPAPRCDGKGAAAAVAVGAKRTLVFFQRRRGDGVGGARADWAMHEYRLLPAGLHGAACGQTPAVAKEWVVCRIFKKTTTPAHRRSPPRVRRRADGDDDVIMAPSTPSSCVTDGGGGGDGEEGEEESSSCSIAASNCP